MWRVHFDPNRELLLVQLIDQVTAADMRDISEAHAEALQSMSNHPFRMFVDLRGLFPMEGDSVRAFAELKSKTAERAGFGGLLVLADSATVAMQQHNTRIGHPHELITTDVHAASEFLAERSGGS